MRAVDIFTAVVLLFTNAGASPTRDPEAAPPIAQLANGTVRGRHDATFNQDLFLGMPFAQSPLNDLRFRRPQPVNKTWTTPNNATAFGPRCLGFPINLVGFDTPESEYASSEDCLTINVVRPSLTPSDYLGGLPVLIWIYGGGYSEGGSADPRYNYTSLVSRSQAMSKPTILVSFNYRTSGWGFLSSTAVQNANISNLGYHDQRLALEWVQENIASFGGDPSRVTIAGQSSGGYSVGAHLQGYALAANPPFRAAIAQSGSPWRVYYLSAEGHDAVYAQILNSTSCTSAPDPLACLRVVPLELLNATFSKISYTQFQPVPDGEIIPFHPARALQTGRFARVPLLTGTVTNEGTSFLSAFRSTLNVTDADSFWNTVPARTLVLGNTTTAAELRAQYEALDLDAYQLGSVAKDLPGFPGWGAATLAEGDFMFSAARRASTLLWARYGVDAWSYRFATDVAGLAPTVYGAAHFNEVPFVFGDVATKGFETNPFDVQPEERRRKYETLSELTSGMWIAFVNGLDPNEHGIQTCQTHWPKFTNSCQENFVFDGNDTNYVEPDTWRKELKKTVADLGLNI